MALQHAQDVVGALAATLQQGIDMAASLAASQFTHRSADLSSDSPGAHLRHHLEHVELLLDGVDAAVIDYDARQRDMRLQTDPEHAAARSRTILTRLRGLNEADLERPVRIVQRLDPASDTSVSTTSTLGRELLFLYSHAVHHYAIVALMLRLQGVQPDAELGLMPSTITWRRQNA